jgi:hypothetical protein
MEVRRTVAKLLIQAWCGLVLTGVVAVTAAYAWMAAQIAGVTLPQVMETIRFTVAFGLAWLLYERVVQRRQERPGDLR